MRLIAIWALVCAAALAQSPLERAVVFARQGHYVEARAALNGVAPPVDGAQRIAFHRLKAAIASGLGERPLAVEEMKSALALAPGDPALLLATALAESQAGHTGEALEHVRAAGDSAVAKALAGDIYEQRGEFVEAANAYREAVRLAPADERYRIALALEFVQHQNFRLAIQVLESAAPLFPRSAKIRALLGVARYADSDLEAAVESLCDALAIDPKLAPAYDYLTRIVLESAGAPQPRALKMLCGWNEVVCGALKLRAARESGNSGLQDEAIAVLRRAPEDNGLAQCELGRAYQWLGSGEARTRMEACVALDPSPENHYRLGLIYTKLGLPRLAEAQMQLRAQKMKELTEDSARRLRNVQAFR